MALNTAYCAAIVPQAQLLHLAVGGLQRKGDQHCPMCNLAERVKGKGTRPSLSTRKGSVKRSSTSGTWMMRVNRLAANYVLKGTTKPVHEKIDDWIMDLSTHPHDRDPDPDPSDRLSRLLQLFLRTFKPEEKDKPRLWICARGEKDLSLLKQQEKETLTQYMLRGSLLTLNELKALGGQLDDNQAMYYLVSGLDPARYGKAHYRQGYGGTLATLKSLISERADEPRISNSSPRPSTRDKSLFDLRPVTTAASPTWDNNSATLQRAPPTKASSRNRSCAPIASTTRSGSRSRDECIYFREMKLKVQNMERTAAATKQYPRKPYKKTDSGFSNSDSTKGSAKIMLDTGTSTSASSPRPSLPTESSPYAPNGDMWVHPTFGEGLYNPKLVYDLWERVTSLFHFKMDSTERKHLLKAKDPFRTGWARPYTRHDRASPDGRSQLSKRQAGLAVPRADGARANRGAHQHGPATGLSKTEAEPKENDWKNAPIASSARLLPARHHSRPANAAAGRQDPHGPRQLYPRQETDVRIRSEGSRYLFTKLLERKTKEHRGGVQVTADHVHAPGRPRARQRASHQDAQELATHQPLRPRLQLTHATVHVPPAARDPRAQRLPADPRDRSSEHRVSKKLAIPFGAKALAHFKPDMQPPMRAVIYLGLVNNSGNAGFRCLDLETRKVITANKLMPYRGTIPVTEDIQRIYQVRTH
ncbi:hypothetical protein BASA62_009502 [Batrachochytrium salamandrivorans]|nr:hypothetical protein BASA62_009502 [Batrachochytrium salamandrivorans]